MVNRWLSNRRFPLFFLASISSHEGFIHLLAVAFTRRRKKEEEAISVRVYYIHRRFTDKKTEERGMKTEERGTKTEERGTKKEERGKETERLKTKVK